MGELQASLSAALATGAGRQDQIAGLQADLAGARANCPKRRRITAFEAQVAALIASRDTALEGLAL
jgi:chemotaxis protein MotB